MKLLPFRLKSLLAVVAGLFLVAGSAAGCGGAAAPSSDAASLSSGSSADSSTEPQAVGDPQGKPLKIALFYATGNDYLSAGIKAAEEAASEIGATLDVFDSTFNSQTQVNQMESAVTKGDYDYFILSPQDGNLMCDIVKNSVVPAGIKVVTFNGPICGRDLNRAEEIWDPQTVSHVSGQTADIYDAWIQQIIADNPDGGKVAVLTGPPIQANTVNMSNALALLPDSFEVVSNQTTDYTTPQGFALTQTALQANPDISIIISNYSGVTMGAVQAVKDAGKADQVRVYDFGGNKWALGAVKTGDLRQTVMMLPHSETREAILAAYADSLGEVPPRFIDLTKSSTLPGTPYVTAANVDSFTPEY